MNKIVFLAQKSNDNKFIILINNQHEEFTEELFLLFISLGISVLKEERAFSMEDDSSSYQKINRLRERLKSCSSLLGAQDIVQTIKSEGYKLNILQENISIEYKGMKSWGHQRLNQILDSIPLNYKQTKKEEILRKSASVFFNKYNLWNQVIIFLIAIFLSFYLGMLVTKKGLQKREKPIQGYSLAYYDEYPILVNSQSHLVLDPTLLLKCMEKCLKEENTLGALECVYLVENNNFLIEMPPKDRQVYDELNRMLRKSNQQLLNDINKNKDQILSSYAAIVESIGKTFEGAPYEILLHDTRNPMRSVVAIKNSLSGRKVGDPNTNFGLKLIKSFSANTRKGAPVVNYGLKLTNGKQLKSSTIPIFHPDYGLVAFICMNVDITQIKEERLKLGVDEDLRKFADSMIYIDDSINVNESLEVRRKKRWI